ncbi:PPE family protein [Mycobacterium vicinigordonae]|uniref:PPE family protein n=1 Tax=Mycobacterium vicinigordonae TaxID=1719132 RepID=A0A7D6I2G3_9MYCO|nr:PPE family protein [Mycobacterium vicinigordonae]QLL08514.1 PPE family protein [Mycobacterium vicinigordonae]
MEFITLPPEISSALIHSGPGAASLTEASYAWQRLGVELDESASVYTPAVAALAGLWHGPASSTMVDAVAPYLSWMRTTAQQCRQLGLAAQAVVSEFNSTLSTVVHPAVVAANRQQLAQLLATNGLGRNLTAIAETEAQYERMWVNNAAAMYRYETATAQALLVEPFTSPPQITDAEGEGAQAAAVQTASATSAGTAARSAQSAMASTAAALPADAVAPPVSPIDALVQAVGVTFDPNQGWFGLANTYANQFISSGFPINLLSYMAQNTSAQALQSVAPDVAQGLSEGEAALGDMAAGLSNAAGALGSIEPAAAMGAAVQMGALSAPPAATGVLTAAHSMPVQLASAASPLPAADAGGGFPMLPPLMPPPVSAGSGWKKRKEPKYEDLAMGLELKGTFMTRPPSAG